jgi:hypothetical protein
MEQIRNQLVWDEFIRDVYTPHRDAPNFIFDSQIKMLITNDKNNTHNIKKSNQVT